MRLNIISFIIIGLGIFSRAISNDEAIIFYIHICLLACQLKPRNDKNMSLSARTFFLAASGVAREGSNGSEF
jgi:hypothetical protein